MLHQTLFMAGTFLWVKSFSTESFKDVTAWNRAEDECVLSWEVD